MTIYRKGDGTGGGRRDGGGGDDHALAPGTILADRYRIIRRLGAGGMGVVYEVHDAHLDGDATNVALVCHHHIPVARARGHRAAFVCDAPRPEPALLDKTEEVTRPLDLGSANDKLERIVVDLGGTPLALTARSVTALFGAPLSLGDDAARAARAAHALIAGNVGGRAGIDTDRVLFRRSLEQTPTAAGEAIAHAQELARDADVDQVRVSPATARQLAGRFKVTEIFAEGSLDIAPTNGRWWSRRAALPTSTTTGRDRRCWAAMPSWRACPS